MSHTPTPWKWEWDGKPCGDEHYGLLEGQDGIPVLEVDDLIDERIVVTAANARLIAAAPDLLEACQMAYDEFQPLSLGEEDSAMSLLRAAIAKATNGGKPT